MPLSILIALALGVHTSKMSKEEYEQFEKETDKVLIRMIKVLFFGLFLGIVIPYILFGAGATSFGYWYTSLYWVLVLLLYANDKIKLK